MACPAIQQRDVQRLEHLTPMQDIIETIRKSPLSGSQLRKFALQQIANLPGYDSCYIYLLKEETLVLEHFVGDPTEHTTIPVGVGICGTAVAENKNQVIADVSKIENYLSCSIKTKSELVVLIRKENRILGQIDIDGHTIGTFTKADEQFLEEVAEILAERWV